MDAVCGYASFAHVFRSIPKNVSRHSPTTISSALIVALTRNLSACADTAQAATARVRASLLPCRAGVSGTRGKEVMLPPGLIKRAHPSWHLPGSSPDSMPPRTLHSRAYMTLNSPSSSKHFSRNASGSTSSGVEVPSTADCKEKVASWREANQVTRA